MMPTILAFTATGFSVLGCLAFGLAGVLACCKSDVRRIESAVWVAMFLALVASAAVILFLDWYGQGFIWTMVHVIRLEAMH